MMITAMKPLVVRIAITRVPFIDTRPNQPGIRPSRLIAMGILEALRIPALAVVKKANRPAIRRDLS